MSNITIKKQYLEVIALLEANKGKKVSSILDEVLALCEAKKGGSNGETFKKDDEGNVTHVFCWYHKEWEAVAEVEYGTKKGTATGLNTMCKQGVSSWTKAQRVAKQQKAELMDKVLSGELTPGTDEVNEALAAIEEQRNTIVARI